MPIGPLLALDIGNTSINIGITDSAMQLAHTWRVRTNRDQLPDDLALMFKGLFELSKVELPKQAVLSSVAPPVGQNIQIALKKYFDIQTFEVAWDNLPDVRIELDEPGSIGADRLANLFGAEQYFGEHEYVIVVDFGTGTNFDVIGRNRVFLGGVLTAGAQISADALFARAAKLPRINLTAPKTTLGKNTLHALQSGLVFGYAEMVDGMLRRLQAELPSQAFTVATGGFARTVEGICKEIKHYDDHLTLRGLITLWSSR